jgi:TolB-like protein/Flp pilus assembly protein TadD
MQSVKIAQKAVSLDDTDPDVHSLLGMINLYQRKHDKAIAFGKSALALGPSNAEVHAIFAMIMLYSGNFEEAVNASKKALRLCPHYPSWFLVTLGAPCYFLGRYEEAIEALKVSLVRSKNEGDLGIQIMSHFYLASAYIESGRKNEANQHVEDILKINPKFSLEWPRKLMMHKYPKYERRLLESLHKAGIPEHPALPLPDKPSVAVLPFVNMSGDPAQDYFSDGISEEIISALAKVPNLFVIARNSSFTYKGKPVWIPTVGRELGVRYVLEGSVRKAGDKVRVTAQLIDAETNKHIWAERYDRELKDIFAIQDEITMKIIMALQVKLTEGEQARTLNRIIKRLDVHLKGLEARSLWAEGSKKAHIRFGQVAQEIIDMAPECSVGYQLLGWHYWWLGIGGKSPKESIGKAFKLAQKVVSMDETDSRAHALLGSVYMLMRQYDKAIAAGQRSVELEPNGAMVHGLLGNTLSCAGRPDEAISHLKQAIRLNPFPQYWYFLNLGRCYRQKGQYEKSLAELKKAQNLAPGNLYSQIHLTVTYSLLGREEEARTAGKKLLEIKPNFSVERYAKGRPYKNQADTKQIIDGLRKAGLK